MSQVHDRASTALRFVYLAAIACCIVLPTVSTAMSVFRNANLSGTAVLLGTYLLATLGIAIWRFVQVVRRTEAVASPPHHPIAAAIRGLGLIAMIAGILAFIGQFFVAPITHALFHRNDGGDSGAGYMVVGMWLRMFSGVAFWGVLIFELGRLISRMSEKRRVAIGI